MLSGLNSDTNLLCKIKKDHFQDCTVVVSMSDMIEMFKAGIMGALMGFLMSFLMNYFLIPFPADVLGNGINNGISGFLSGFMGGFVGLFVYFKMTNRKV